MQNRKINTNTNTQATEVKADGSFEMKIGRTTYLINVYFNKNSKETLEDKVKRLILQDVKNGNF